MNMLSSTHFHILWNGTPLLAIVPSRGVHQGDPLSPYTFILCLERLSILLEEAVRDRAIHLVTFSGQIKISHIFFANNIFLFSKAKIMECITLKTFFKNSISALAKSLVQKVMSRRTKELIASIFDILTMT